MTFQELVSKVGLVEAIITAFSIMTPEERKKYFAQLKLADWVKLLPKLAAEPAVRDLLLDKATEFGSNVQRWLRLLRDKVADQLKPTEVKIAPADLVTLKFSFEEWLELFLDQSSNESTKAFALEKMADCAQTDAQWCLLLKHAPDGSAEKQRARQAVLEAMKPKEAVASSESTDSSSGTEA